MEMGTAPEKKWGQPPKGIAMIERGTGPMRIVLASGSPRRRELMAREGFEFDVLTSDCDESYDAKMAPVDVAPYLAGKKAHAVAATLQGDASNAVVIGADTIVALGSQIYGKPADADDACRMLRELSGKTHQVITGVCVIAPQGEQSFADITDVTFRELSDEEISAYVAGGEPMDKAGAYGIQGDGGALVDYIDGDFDNVVGLPVKRLARMLLSIESA